MNIHFYILFTLTFFTGVAAGAVLYVGAFAPTQQPVSPPPVSERTFELRGERFTTGCISSAAGCDRLTLSANRRLELVEDGEDVEAVRVSSAYFRELTATVYVAPLEQIQSESVACQRFDRVGSQYMLVYQGEVYNLHACSDTYRNSELFTQLEPLWDNGVATTTIPFAVFEEGVTNSIQQYLRSQFDWSGE